MENWCEHKYRTFCIGVKSVAAEQNATNLSPPPHRYPQTQIPRTDTDTHTHTYRHRCRHTDMHTYTHMRMHTHMLATHKLASNDPETSIVPDGLNRAVCISVYTYTTHSK